MDPTTRDPGRVLPDHHLTDLAEMEIRRLRKMGGQTLMNREVIRRMRHLRGCRHKGERWRALMDRGIEILQAMPGDAKA